MYAHQNSTLFIHPLSTHWEIRELILATVSFIPPHQDNFWQEQVRLMALYGFPWPIPALFWFKAIYNGIRSVHVLRAALLACWWCGDTIAIVMAVCFVVWCCSEGFSGGAKRAKKALESQFFSALHANDAVRLRDRCSQWGGQSLALFTSNCASKTKLRAREKQIQSRESKMWQRGGFFVFPYYLSHGIILYYFLLLQSSWSIVEVSSSQTLSQLHYYCPHLSFHCSPPPYSQHHNCISNSYLFTLIQYSQFTMAKSKAAMSKAKLRGSGGAKGGV